MDRIVHLWRHAPAWKLSVIAVIGISLTLWIFPPNHGAFDPPKKTGAVQTAPSPAPPVVAPPSPAAPVARPSTKKEDGQVQTTPLQKTETDAERMKRLFREMDTLKPIQKTQN